MLIRVCKAIRIIRVLIIVTIGTRMPASALNFIDRIEKDQLILNAHNLKFALAKGQKTDILGFLPSIRT